MIFIALMRIGDPLAERLLHRYAGDPADITKKPESQLAREILRFTAVKLTGRARVEWDFASDADGRPLLVHRPSETPPPNVSLSHSGLWAACAISCTTPVGIDVEQHRSTRNFAAIAETGFGPEERRRILNGGMPAFYRIWTIREAVAKATGRGMAQVTNGVDYAAEGPETGSWLSKADGRQWQLTHLTPEPDISLGVAVPDLTIQPQWWPFGWEDDSE